MSMADRDGFIWMDGKLVPWREANIHVLTHSLHYGMGVFEGVRAYKTAGGTAEGDTLVSIEELFGSDYNDILHGTDGWNLLGGSDGADTLKGAGGGDEFVHLPGPGQLEGAGADRGQVVVVAVAADRAAHRERGRGGGHVEHPEHVRALEFDRPVRAPVAAGVPEVPVPVNRRMVPDPSGLLDPFAATLGTASTPPLITVAPV